MLHKKILLPLAIALTLFIIMALRFSGATSQKDDKGAENTENVSLEDANWIDSTHRAGVTWESTNKEEKHLWKNRSKQYNIVLITVNLLRVDHLSVYGYGRRTTPAMEDLSRQAFVFSNMFTNSDYTMPNMMSIITSLYPVAHGVFDAFKDELSTKVRTLAEILKLSGYSTSWYALQMPHLDTSVGFGRGYNKITELKKDYSNVPAIADWISSQKDQPFFVGINSRSIHPPYMPPPQFKDRFYEGGEKGNIATTEKEFRKTWYENILELMTIPDSPMYEVLDEKVIAENQVIFNGKYEEYKLFKIQELLPEDKKIRFGFTHMITFLNMIDPHDRENLDYAVSLYDACVLGIDQLLVQPIISALKEANVYDDTIIIITGDHGESLGEHNYVGHNQNFYEQLVHVPLIIKHPDLSTRVNITDLAQSVDIMPTIFDLVNIAQPYNSQGKSLIPLLEDNSSNPLNKYVYGQKRSQAYIRSNRWKLTLDLERDKQEEMCSWARLFDIQKDPGERTDLCETQREIMQEMLEKLLSHLDTTPRYIDKDYQFLPSVDEKTRKRIKETGYW